MNKFNGFSIEAINFLKDVKFNNSKEWFENNKNAYNEYLLTPFQCLVEELSVEMLKIDSAFEVRPQINRTISKIYRDTRFSKDKSLFKDTMWLTFKKASKEWKEAPAFFFEITPTMYRYGMGYYSAKRDSMDIFRELINKDTKSFKSMISKLEKSKIFSLEGESYKKSIYEGNDNKIKSWYDRKNIYLVYNSDNLEELFSRKIINDLINGYNNLNDIYKYFCKVEQIRMKRV